MIYWSLNWSREILLEHIELFCSYTVKDEKPQPPPETDVGNLKKIYWKVYNKQRNHRTQK